MVHQHFMLVEVFTVAENLILGRERGTAGCAEHGARPGVRCASCRSATGCDVDPDALVEDLPVGVQQRVEILKALANDAKYLIFDEPTAVLTPQEIDELIAVMRSLRDEGKAIVFITHKLREVRAIADKITVIRRGKVVGTGQAHRLRGSAGRADGGPRRQPAGRQGARAGGQSGPRLPAGGRGGGRTATARWWSTTSTSRSPAARSSASPGSRATGRPSWPRRCSGVTPTVRGRVLLDGEAAHRAEPEADHRRRAGLRARRTASTTGSSARSPWPRTWCSTTSTSPRTPRASPWTWPRSAPTPSTGWPSSTSAPSRSSAPGASLSGGNQQKVVLARELSRPLAALIANQPTRGRGRRRDRVPALAAGRRA